MSVMKSANELVRERDQWAAEMTPAERFIAGAKLFDYACRITMAGIRSQHPNATEDEVLDILRERLEWARRQEAH